MMATDAMVDMEAKKLTYMPVVGENNKLEGVLTLHDMVAAGLHWTSVFRNNEKGTKADASVINGYSILRPLF
eukprot:998934-Prorocentrum_minimum.AAC.1